HFTLVEAMSVAENVHLGQEGGFFLRQRSMEKRVARLASRYELQVDPGKKVFDLSMGEKQRVEILKLLHRQSRVLIFDEPTAVLTPTETEQLFQALRLMAAQGKAVVFISHKLREIMTIADEVFILRRGKVIDRMEMSDVESTSDLARRMVGREVLFQVEREQIPLGETVLELENLTGEGFSGINLTIRQGEILALVGVAGNGQKPLVETICGLRDPNGGTASLFGRGLSHFYGPSGDQRFMSYIPEDRLGLGTCPNLTLVENFLMTNRNDFRKGPFLDRNGAARAGEKSLRTFNVQPPNPQALARRLSGGNLQKMVLAREFFHNPRFILAEQPTQGLDISATEEVWKHLIQAKHNAGILLVTGDLNEAMKLADRIAVIFQGRLMAVFSSADKQMVDSIGPMMAGIPV
ncbi:MAG: ABC transporter ATP-binding protein, partial [Desulfovibrionales bacterium]